MAEETSSSPPCSTATSRSSSTSSRSSRPSLTLDLSNLPPLPQPSPPSNTLLITELQDLYLFQPKSLDLIRDRITQIAPLNSFSPLPSLRRIVCSFHSDDEATRVRQELDGDNFLNRNVRARVYFGEHTPIETTEEARRRNFLQAPQSQKLFFISPPPSPPHGWAVKNEEPPNKEVHANDLATALSQLECQGVGLSLASPLTSSPETYEPLTAGTASLSPSASGRRSRSSTVIYDPSDHGSSPNLPAVMVEDTSAGLDDSDTDMSLLEVPPRKITTHTTRPPVELME